MSESSKSKKNTQETPVYIDQRANTGFEALARLSKGGVDPYVNQFIDANNQASQKSFMDRLAQIRSANFRGSETGDITKQGDFVQQFSNQQSADNARLLSDAFQNSENRSLGASSQLLNALRGTRSSEKDSRSGVDTGKALSTAALIASFFV